VAVGDIVKYSITKDDVGMISAIEPRINYIIRKASKLSKESHLLAANVDQALLVVTLKDPVTPYEFIDRFLVTAEAYHIPTYIILNKADLYTDAKSDDLSLFLDTYKKAGYTCHIISVKENQNLERIKNLIQNKTSVIAGNSGVGKSSIINAIDKNISIKTNEISDYHKSGKHTTTFAEMYFLNMGGKIIDTPGIRGFGIIDFEKNEPGLFFPEIFSISKNCKFYNCTHIHEPDCAVIKAVELNKIGISRYRSYVNIYQDEHLKYRK
jgi:ribosome biogenesis GTPase